MADELTKPNDWLAILKKNPDMNLADLKRNGITADNSSMLAKDDYKKMDAVRKAFSNDKGEFDENQFNAFYDGALALYNQYANDEQTATMLHLTYSSDAFWAPQGATKRTMGATLSLSGNPLKDYNVGISHIGAIDLGGPANLSAREDGQTQKVVDYETGKELDWTPNDYAGSFSGFFKSFATPTIVLAQWDEDGYHTDPETGEQM